MPAAGRRRSGLFVKYFAFIKALTAVAQLDRLARLKRLLSPRVADLIVAGELDDPLVTRRKEVTIAFTDLRGFTAFSETADPVPAYNIVSVNSRVET